MVSANVDALSVAHVHDRTRQNHFVKPVNLDLLLDRLRELLGFAWIEANPEPVARLGDRGALPDAETLRTLEALSSIGHVAGLRETIDRFVLEQPGAGDFADALSARLERYDLAGVDALLAASGRSS